MQALEKIGVLEHNEEKGGRRITQSGKRDLDRESNIQKNVHLEFRSVWSTASGSQAKLHAG